MYFKSIHSSRETVTHLKERSSPPLLYTVSLVMKYRLLQAVLFLSLVALCSSALSKHYYIVPVNSTDSACQDYQNGICLTLEKLAQSDLTLAGGTNLTLSFLPGEHLLTKSLAIHNFTHVQMIGINESVVNFHGKLKIEIAKSDKLSINGKLKIEIAKSDKLSINGKLKIEIAKSDKLSIKNLGFVQNAITVSSNKQQGLNIIKIRSVYIDNCHYEGIDNQPLDGEYDHNLSAVKISGSRNVTIVNVTFEGNYGNVLTVESHDITILGMNFTRNNGSGVHINSTNTMISDSTFNANTGRVLTIDSDSTVMTRCNVSNNVNPHPDCEQSGIITITPHPSVSNNTTTNCSVVPTFYCVRTHDTTLRLCNRKGRCNNQSTNMYHRGFEFSHNTTNAIDTHDRYENEHLKMKTSNYTAYFCIDISDMPSTDLGNISSVNDFIFDFTTSSTSSSHGNKGRLCVNTDHLHTLPFTNRVVYCDDKTDMFLVTKSDTHTWEDVDILYPIKICSPHFEQVIESDACLGVESECTSNTFNGNGANTSSCSDPPLETIDISCVDSHTIGLCDAIVITSCTFTNNTSDRGALSIASGCDDHAYYKLDSVHVTCCVFTNNTSYQNGGAFSIASRNGGIINVDLGTVIITSSVFSSNVNTVGDGGAFSIASGYRSHINTNLGNVLVTSCTFTNNTNNSTDDTGADGGAISIASGSEGHLNVTAGNVLVTSCVFMTNKCINGNGGAFFIASGYKEHGNIDLKNLLITNCTFNNNYGLYSGGAVSIGPCFNTFASASLRNVLITACTFTNNGGLRGGAVSIGIAFDISHTDISLENVLISFSTFAHNSATVGGGAFSIFRWRGYNNSVCFKSVLIASCTFTNNKCRCSIGGAALFLSFSMDGSKHETSMSSIVSLCIISCKFINNNHGGALLFNIWGNSLNRSCTLHSCDVRVTISYSYLHGNRANYAGSTIYYEESGGLSTLSIISSFITDSSSQGIYLIGVKSATFVHTYFINNENSVITLTRSTVTFLSGNLFSNNNGSVYAVISNINFKGLTIFSNNYHSAPVYAAQSQIHFNSPEGITITNNTASLGGGIYLRESTMTVSHPINISQNIADNGGGIYAFLSSIEFTSENVVMIIDNYASQSGGGICAIASTIKISQSFVNIISNSASVNGGGIFLDQNTKIYLLKLDLEFGQASAIRARFNLYKNSAQYGGGIFIDDKTAERSVCIGKSYCFLQTLSIKSGYVIRISNNRLKSLVILNTFIINNTATVSGSAIYGGLLDRCTIDPLAETLIFASNGLDYFNKTVAFSKDTEIHPIPSEKHLCNILLTNCSNNTRLQSYISSKPVRVVFCDEHHQSIAHIRKGGSFKVPVLAMDQVGKPVNATIHSSVLTESEATTGRLKEGQTEQTVGNRCTELEYNVFSQDSSAQLELYADGPCTNLGISRKWINIKFAPCMCAIGFIQSHRFLDDCQCVCDPRLQLYQIRNCSQSAETIKLEINIWIGVQENFTNRTGYIIHDCPFDYCVEKPVNISLNSSQERDKQCAFDRSGVLCGKCKQGLSLVLGTSRCKDCSNIYLLLLIPFALAGIVLVVFILLFNITIATGTIHGLIFYTNVLAANKAIFLPFTTPNFLTVFISWVNLDLGIETCFYSQMSSQVKVLLQLVFPAYLFLLIFLIIILSRCFDLFSKLLSNRNPVAALATLIVLSYSKLLRFIIAALQNTVLDYPDGSQERVWLYDANVHFFTPSHVPRFVATAIILIAGGMFTVLLFFSQWLPRCSNWKLMKWTRNTKYTGFMDAYHAPFTPKHRYWVGLLLFALIVHNTVAAMATDTFLPVLSAGSLSVGLIVLRVFGSRVYKDWSKDCLETIFLLNLAVLTNGTFYAKGLRYRHQTLANISMAISFTLFMMIICYHCYKYMISNTRMWLKLTVKISSLKNNIAELRLRQATNQRQAIYQVIANTPENDNDDLLSEDTSPAMRADQLREPDLDDLAPITTDDYRPAPHPPRPRANNRQEVTYSVIEM